MNLDEIVKSIDPGLCPGGVVIRVFTDDKLMAERRVTNGDEAMVVGVMDRDAAMRIAERTIAVHTWDGDSGEFRVRHELTKQGDAWASTAIYMSTEFSDSMRRVDS